MKRMLILMSVLLLVLCVTACAQAAEIRPQDINHLEIDLTDGTFFLGVKDADRIIDGGWFTASLYVPDHYDAAQIEAMVPGDTVLVNGQAWTIREVVPHGADEPGLVDTYEIYTEEENDGYIVFIHEPDGCYICQIDDWAPVTPVGDVRVMLPLPDKFEYYSGEDTEPRGMDALVNDLEEYGSTFVPYNTFCSFEDGKLFKVVHYSYPMGPEETPDEDEPAAEPDTAEDAEAVPVWKFCHGVRDGLETAVIKGYTSNCEEGPSEIEMTAEEIEDIRNIAINGVITGKANDLSVTGGTWFYTFETPEGEHLLTVELYKGWIVSVDGMYTYHK